jgi:hypothetical protein
MFDPLQKQYVPVVLGGDMIFLVDKLHWINKPPKFSVSGKEIRISTELDTDLW